MVNWSSVSDSEKKKNYEIDNDLLTDAFAFGFHVLV